MTYFVVERSDDGTLGIPLPQAFGTREAALAALSAATSSGEVRLGGEVYIADLGSAIPVLVMPVAAPVVPAPAEEIAEATIAAEPDETAGDLTEGPEDDDDDSVAALIAELQAADLSDEPAELEEDAAEVAYTAWEPLEEAPAEGASLADALKRATTSLEGEGIVAPESIDSAPATEAEVAPEVPGEEPEPEDEPAIEAEGLGEPPLPTDDAPVTEQGQSWPWANVESYEISAAVVEELDEPDTSDAIDVSEPASITLSEPDSEAVEPVSEDSPIITSAPRDGEDAYLPHPVILGDYGASGVIADLEEFGEADASGASEESDSTDEVEMAAEPESPEVAISDWDASDENVTSLESELAALETGYEPAGDLDLAGYTCQDCVYSNTCPKVGQVSPAECGSFQWKSE